MTTTANPHSAQETLSALVASYHGLDEPSREIVVGVLDKALSPIVPTLDVAKAFGRDDINIYHRALDKVFAIVEGNAKPPTTTPQPMKLAARKRYGHFVMDEASKAIAEDVIVRALLPLVTNKKVARAVEYDDYLIFAAKNQIKSRLRYPANDARHA